MPTQTPIKRVESLEQRVTILEQLPVKVDELALQITHLRMEMHAEFSVIRGEVRASGDQIMSHARTLYEDMTSRLALMEEDRPRRRKQR